MASLAVRIMWEGSQVWGGDGWTGSLVTVEGVAIVSWNMANYKLVYVREGLKKPGYFTVK